MTRAAASETALRNEVRALRRELASFREMFQQAMAQPAPVADETIGVVEAAALMPKRRRPSPTSWCRCLM